MAAEGSQNLSASHADQCERKGRHSPSAIDDLRHAASTLEKSSHVADRRFAAGLRRYIATARNGLTCDIALNLSPAPGHDAWWTEELRVRRNELVRQYAALLPAEYSLSRKAKVIAEQAGRRQALRQTVDSKNALVADTVDAIATRLIDSALRTGLRFPNRRQVFNILCNQHP